MASVFLPILLLGVWNLQEKKYLRATWLLYFGVLGTALTHPMMLMIFFVPVAAYFIYSLHKNAWKKELLLTTVSITLGVLSAGYYLIPLVTEMKYFYQSRLEHVIGKDTFLSFQQLYNPEWFYTLTHPGPRGNYIKLGTIEFIVLIVAGLFLFLSKILSKSKLIKLNIDKAKIKDLLFWTVVSVVLIVLMLPISGPLYLLPIVYQIQYPWRFLAALQITIPMIFIFLVKVIKKINNQYFLLVIMAIILWFRIPQFYGKNYITQPESNYYFNQANLHSTNFNTVWSGNSEDYDRKTVQAAIIDGDG
jgi:hypothetical protein